MPRSSAALNALRGRMLVRDEKERDRTAVHALNASAFETSAEADLVDALREQAHPVVSLVAEDPIQWWGTSCFRPFHYQTTLTSRSWVSLPWPLHPSASARA